MGFPALWISAACLAAMDGAQLSPAAGLRRAFLPPRGGSATMLLLDAGCLPRLPYLLCCMPRLRCRLERLPAISRLPCCACSCITPAARLTALAAAAPPWCALYTNPCIYAGTTCLPAGHATFCLLPLPIPAAPASALPLDCMLDMLLAPLHNAATAHHGSRLGAAFMDGFCSGWSVIRVTLPGYANTRILGALRCYMDAAFSAPRLLGTAVLLAKRVLPCGSYAFQHLLSDRAMPRSGGYSAGSATRLPTYNTNCAVLRAFFFRLLACIDCLPHRMGAGCALSPLRIACRSLRASGLYIRAVADSVAPVPAYHASLTTIQPYRQLAFLPLFCCNLHWC